MTRTERAAIGPLFGRDTLVADISSILTTGRHVLLTGRAGVGKSRLAAELVDEAIVGGRRVERVMASAATAPFQLGAFAPFAGSLASNGADVPTVLNFHLARWRSQVHANGPVTLWVDDVHHLDELSAVLCRHGIAAGLIQLIATHRTSEALPSDITALLTAGDLEMVEVPRLSRASTAELATQSSERQLTEAEIDEVQRLSDGFPLFIRDLTRCLDSGSPVEEIHRGTGLHETLRGLPAPLRRVAEMIAVAEPIPIRLLTRHRAALLDLMARGVVRRHGDDDVRLEHPLYSSWFVEALGPLIADVFDDLVESTEGLDVAPVLAADWRLRAGRTLDPDLAAAALRETLAVSDRATALRFIGHLGEGSEILAAQAVLLGGDLDEGLSRLDHIRLTSPDVRQRVEAAGLLARHVGLTKGDFATARTILSDADDADLAPGLRIPLLLGRLWLSAFGGPIVREDVELLHALIGQPALAEQITYDVLLIGLVLTAQLDGSSRSRPLLERMQVIEREVGVDRQAQTRGCTGEAWIHLLDGDGPAALERVTRRFDEISVGADDAEGVGLLGGSGGYVAAVCGAVQLSVTMSSAAAEAAFPVDWFGHGHLGALVQQGSTYLAGGVRRSMDPLPVAPAAPVDLDLASLLAARAESLWVEAIGRAASASTLLGPLEMLATNLKTSWVCLGAAELVDHRSDRAIHELLIESLSGVASTEPVHAALVDIARARLSDDAEGMLNAGERFESFGFVSAASRGYADVLRLADEPSELHRHAVQGLARCVLAWDGGPMWWTAELDNVPTPRQLIVAHLAATGLSSGDIANELILSKRTVENHLYRAIRLLGVSARDELAGALAPLGFGPRIVPPPETGFSRI